MDIDNLQDMIDSRDIIARIEELAGMVDEAESPEAEIVAELATLRKVAEQGENSPDWEFGEGLIRDSYFTEYTEQLIDDCYELPKEMNSGEWPWRHVKVDYEAAAGEMKADYFDVDFDGVTYWIRG